MEDCTEGKVGVVSGHIWVHSIQNQSDSTVLNRPKLFLRKLPVHMHNIIKSKRISLCSVFSSHIRLRQSLNTVNLNHTI